MADTQIFEPDGRAIPYAIEGNGAAVVLIAGQGLNIDSLGTLAHSVAAEDFTLVRIGSRRPADAAVSMRDIAQDVIDVMDHLEVADAWVGGHGFGGSVAREVAVDYADRVNGLLLLGVESADQAGGLEVAQIPEHLRDADVAELQGAAREASDLAPLAEGIPVLVIQATEDPITPAANGDALQAAAPDRVSVVRVEGAAHMFPVTHIGEASWAIEDYLDWD
ncbi:pimeloyl-ACP methyl ester carboxylesterase [Microbacterium endophyticum]|uniref:Pimeloyl-ACP methyl ester carboxylesterase n=1 Tax=Microbacterium endophyticum TaxID=1526412 RepID=A0A7W4V285_9MICO|nr:alpha/beta hydrolase [Microbacterium endophyticum]MBB2974823.1 pimeloyl-ACP methyl ester carboxylesterase [Microbacterium endophyticum]NIK37120.1 pimeloyl-ACP methyl ester carboxylesterase [Microbacterium endophyticum]